MEDSAQGMDAKAEDDRGVLAAVDEDPVRFVREVVMPDAALECQITMTKAPYAGKRACVWRDSPAYLDYRSLCGQSPPEAGATTQSASGEAHSMRPGARRTCSKATARGFLRHLDER